MNALTRSLAAAAILTGAVLSAPAQALPNCATAIGMSITPPGGITTASSASECLDISGGFNWPYSFYTNTQAEGFRKMLADRWGGTADEWFYLREIDGRSDTISDTIFFDPNHKPDPSDSADLWTGGDNRSLGIASGTFSVDIADPDPSNPLVFVPKLMDIVGVMKPDSVASPGGNNDPGSFADTVLAYLFPSIQIDQRGELTGTFDFRSSTTAPGDYVSAGLGLFARISQPVSPNPRPIPEPGILVLVGVAAIGAAVSRRKRST
jgi:hypothetical protein